MSSIKKKIKSLPLLRISQLEDKSIKEVWILNETSPKGDIILDVKNKADGSTSLVKIPPTWIPVCLTDQVPKSMISESPKFRSILSSGHIKLLDPKGVHELLQDDEIRAEFEEVRSKTMESYKETFPDELKTDSVSAVILDILAREASSSITENEAKDILNTKEDDLTDDDIEYLLKNTGLSKVKKWATDALADRAV
jgi:hypothetical protein